MTALAVPDPRLHDAWADAVRDFAEAGEPEIPASGWWDLPVHLQRSSSREACEALVRVARATADLSSVLPDDRVPADYYWLLDDAGDEAGPPSAAGRPVVLGFLSVRHRLNDFLLEQGGHIGYSVRPSRRREGHAGRALRLGLSRLAGLGVEQALVTCDTTNTASRRTIEAAGGVLDDVRVGKLRFWVPTAPVAAAPARR